MKELNGIGGQSLHSNVKLFDKNLFRILESYRSIGCSLARAFLINFMLAIARTRGKLIGKSACKKTKSSNTQYYDPGKNCVLKTSSD